MAYLTLAALKQMFGAAQINELASGVATTANDTVAQAALDRADAFVKGYVQVRYKGELLSVPPEIAQHTGEIARFYLCKNKVPDFIQRRFDLSFSWLKDLAAGRVIISPQNADTEDEAAVKYSTETKKFADGELDVF